jgi:ribosomal-protein-alanine N-acetyltransferase
MDVAESFGRPKRGFSSQKIPGTLKGQVVIRDASPEDMDYMQALSRKVFGRYGSYEDMLPKWFGAGFTQTLVAQLGKRPIGFAMMGKVQRDFDSPSLVELLAIAIEPELQHRGVGDLLMVRILRKAYEQNVATMVLHTSLDNSSAQKLFIKHGFVPIENKKRFYPMGQDALMMFRHIPKKALK